MSDVKTYAVLGLGVFGSAVAKTLARSGMDVIAIDSNMDAVENAADVIPNAIQADCQDLEALREAGCGNAETAVVAMGSHLEDSIIAIMNLRELGVKQIIAKANNNRYRYVLERVGAAEVVEPEKEMGRRLAGTLLSPNVVDLSRLDESYSLLEVKAPKEWISHSLKELELRSRYGVNVIGIKRSGNGTMSADFTGDTIISETDTLVVVADMKKFSSLKLD